MGETEQHRHETSTRRLREVLDAAAIGLFLIDAAGRIELINRVAEVHAAHREAVEGVTTGSGAWTAIDVDGNPIANEDLPAEVTRRTGRPLDDVEIGLSVGGGEPLWISISTRPLDVAAGLPCAVVVSSRDVTARHEMRKAVQGRERSLAEAERRLRTIFSMAPIGMGIVRNGYVLQANQAWAEIMGRSVEELEGRKVDDFTYPGDPATTEAAGFLGEDGRSAYRVEKRYVHAEGHPVWVQLDLSAVRDGAGAIQYVIVQVQDIADRRRHQEQLEHIANHDALTGLLNRRGFQHALEDHVRRAGRYGAEGAMLMLDLDHFKYVNDTLGHKVGDELIVKAAELLAGRLRESDIVARIGGDEFAILLPHGDREATTTLAVALLAALREWRLKMDPEHGMAARGLTASIGIAMCVPGATADDLVVNADLAMYDAKEDGRDRWALYAVGERGEQPRMKARLSWLGRVRWAIEERAFELFAQPIVDLRGSSDPMYEVLLRLREENGELISPSTFLSIAERVDLVQEIDRLVIDETIAALHRASSPVSLAVNVSGKSVGDPELLAMIDRRLKQSGVAPSALVIEITETAAVAQIEQARAFATELQRLGCRLAIDNFGAGFGSFTYLKHLPFDFLKIDGEFVAGAVHSRADAVIVDAVRHMAHGLGRAVIGGHCTDASLVDFLRVQGVDYAQGYHLGRPAPLEEVLGVNGNQR
jgi:diguanylate cyclase (GGDEF)-like protein/PAS domain S-box-containing protein